MKKCVIITTINHPTQSILKHINNSNYDVIIVGDTKTPSSYKQLDCVFLDIEDQENSYPELSKIIPLNHYSRKNIGYLYAIQHNYDIIYETDDDTEPHDNFDYFIDNNKNFQYNIISDTNKKWINYYKYFTDEFIWPRGYPLSQINRGDNLHETTTSFKPSIICGLVDNDPDVDSIFRLIFSNKIIDWKKYKNVLIHNQNICTFNTQNTFWLDKTIFQSMFIPTTVSFRYCDILRSIIINYICFYKNKYIGIISPNVTQHRNYHNLMLDFKDEIDMFICNENIDDYISKDCYKSMDTCKLIKQIYHNLYDNKILKKNDLDILDIWMNYTND